MLSKGATEIALESLSSTVFFSEDFREEGKETYYTKINPNITVYFFDNLKSIVDFPFDIEISAKVFVSDLM